MAVYLDASAAAKLVVSAEDSAGLRLWLAGRRERISSAVIRTELMRAVRRAEPDRLGRARQLLARLTLVALDDLTLDRAAALEPVTLRSLDAIHLATALGLGVELEVVVTYDRRMIEAARLLGLPVASPA